MGVGVSLALPPLSFPDPPVAILENWYQPILSQFRTVTFQISWFGNTCECSKDARTRDPHTSQWLHMCLTRTGTPGVFDSNQIFRRKPHYLSVKVDYKHRPESKSLLISDRKYTRETLVRSAKGASELCGKVGKVNKSGPHNQFGYSHAL